MSLEANPKLLYVTFNWKMNHKSGMKISQYSIKPQCILADYGYNWLELALFASEYLTLILCVKVVEFLW